jgi:hypothetical protein
MRRIAIGVLVVLAGCGSSGPPKPVHACMSSVRQVIGSHVTARAANPQDGIAGCRYGHGVTVTIDSNPQAFQRFDRAVEERSQVALWSHEESDVPVELQGIGARADWFPSESTMLSTDGPNLVSVEVRPGRHARATARAVSLAVLRGLAP